MLATVRSRFDSPALAPRRSAARQWNPAVEHGAAPERHPGRLAAWLVFVVSLLLLSYVSRASAGDTPDDLAYRYSSSVAAARPVRDHARDPAAHRPRAASARALRAPPARRRGNARSGSPHSRSWSSMRRRSPTRASSRSSATSTPTEEQGLVPDGWDSSRAAPFVAFFLAVTLLAPVVEELTYRGMGVSLVLPYGTVLAVLLTGVLFGLAHGLLVGLPVLAFFGIVVGWLRVRTESIYPPISLHGTFNAIALIASVAASAEAARPARRPRRGALRPRRPPRLELLEARCELLGSHRLDEAPELRRDRGRRGSTP